MKKVLLLAALAAFTTVAHDNQSNAPVRIPAMAAKQHINADAIVSGKVAEIYKTDRVVRLNFERPFPNNTFTAVIFSNKTNLFPDLDKLKDKTVEISGKIADYRGHPEIILTSTNQLKVIDSVTGSGNVQSK